MTKKLTLTVNDRVIEAAKAYAAEQKTSVSALVENYLKLLATDQHADPKSAGESPLTDSIAKRFSKIGKPLIDIDEDPKMQWLDDRERRYNSLG